MTKHLLNPRLIFLVSLCLWIYFLYDAAYVKKVPSGIPYGFLFVSAMGGNFVGLYIIEHHENKLQLFGGYVVLCVFLIVGFGGVFFGW